MNGEVLHWMVVHEDTHGNRDLIKSDLTESEADGLIARFVKDHQHKQEYYKFSYTTPTRREVMREERVRE